MHRKQSGFTIVELVVVIILLGILAATALPRFINIDDEAHTAAFQAVHGSLQTGVSMFHAKAIATDAAPDTVPGGPGDTDFDGLLASGAGFPYGTTDRSGSGSTVAAVADCVEVFENVQQAGAPTITTTTTANDVDDDGGGFDFTALLNGATCEYYHSGHSTTPTDIIGRLTYDPSTGEVAADTFTLVD